MIRVEIGGELYEICLLVVGLPIGHASLGAVCLSLSHLLGIIQALSDGIAG